MPDDITVDLTAELTANGTLSDNMHQNCTRIYNFKKAHEDRQFITLLAGASTIQC